MSLSVEWMFVHSLIQGGPAALKRAMKHGIEPNHLGRYGSTHYKVYDYLLGYVGAERCPNEAEIYTAIDVEVPDCDWECDVEIYAEAVRKQHLRGNLTDGLDKAITKIEDDPDRGRDMLQELFLSTVQAGQRVDFRTNDPDTVIGVVERYDERKKRRLEGRAIGLSTPWDSWTKRCKGYQRGEITSLLAGTGVGKTQLSLVQAVHTWRTDLVAGQNVMFVSLETMRETLLDRVSAIDLKLDYERLTGGYLTEAEEDQLLDFCESLTKEPDKDRPEIIFYGNEIKTVNDIALRCKEHRPELVVIDGIYLINANAKMARWERITEAIESIRFDIAVGCDVPVMLTCQFSSDSDLAAGGKAKSKYASAIFDSSNVVLGIYGGGDEGASNSRVIRCLKANEFKIPFGLRIDFKMETGEFGEIEVMEDDEDSIFGTGEEMGE